MSLVGALYTSFSGLKDTESKLAVTSSNVSNADKTGYTRKEYASTYASTDFATVPIGGVIESVTLDPYLQATVIEDISASAEASVTDTYLSEYVTRLGSTDGGNTMSAALDSLAASLDQLSVSPEDSGRKAKVVYDAQNVAAQVRSLSNTVQDLRGRADKAIEDTVTRINTLLQEIDSLNDDIVNRQNEGRTSAELEDQRRVALENLSQEMGINYFINSDNRAQIYLGSRAILDSGPHTFSYTAATSVSSAVTYPGGFNAISVDGVDVTTLISGGELGGLITLRDTTFVQEQAKLDEFATVLMADVNAAINTGSSIPPRSTITGDIDGLALTDTTSGTGMFRIAITDQDGVVQSFTDFDMATLGNVGAVIAAINGAFGANATASLTADGELQIVANNTGEGISINPMDSSVGTDAQGFSDYFGLSGLFYGTGAEDIAVSTYLETDPSALPAGALSSSATLMVGDTGIFVGDGTVAKAGNEAITNPTSFSAAGNFGAQSVTLDSYVDKILADAAGQAARAAQDADTAQFVLKQSQTTLQNLTGVNIDEEMTNLVDLESKYSASATLIATIQAMLEELINAVR